MKASAVLLTLTALLIAQGIAADVAGLMIGQPFLNSADWECSSS